MFFPAFDAHLVVDIRICFFSFNTVENHLLLLCCYGSESDLSPSTSADLVVSHLPASRVRT